jgi:3-phenylpropionate/cinnamic acid dioxygenase small subunit
MSSKLGGIFIVVLALATMVFFNMSVMDDSEANATALEQLSTEVQSLQQQQAALYAESEIRNKLQTYMPVLAAGDWDAYVNYFTRDAQLVMDDGTSQGRDAIRARMSSAAETTAATDAGAPARKRTDLLANVEVEVTSATTANASSRFTFLAEDGNGGFEVTGSGRYVDEWALEDGEWRIASRTVDNDLLQPAPAAPAQQ